MTVPRSSLAFAAVAILVSLAATMLAFTGLAAGSLGPVPLGRLNLVLMGGIAPGALATSVALLLPRHRGTVITLVLLGYAAAALAFVSFSVGFDEADGEVAPSPLGSVLMPAVAAAYVLLTAAAAVTMSTLLRFRPLLRTATALLIGLVCAPLLIGVGVGYASLVLAIGTMLTLVVLSAKRPDVPGSPTAGGARPETYDEPGAMPPAPVPASAGAIRAAAFASLAISVLGFGGGISAGIALEGSPDATRAMGLMLAVGNLAAVPLLIALTLRLAPRSRVARLGALGGSLGVASACAYLIADDDPGNPHRFTAVIAIAASVGLWAGTVAWARAGFTVGSRLLTAVLVGLGGVVAYFLAAIGTAGAPLALVSGWLVFRGIRKRSANQVAA